MDLGLAGRVALVTAGSRGLGRASALSLAAEGCKVVICGRTPESLGDTTRAMTDLGAEALAICLDVTDSEAPPRLVEETVDRFGSLDILVGNVGGPATGNALDMTDDQLTETLETQLLPIVRLVRAAAVPMRRTGWGRICLITASGIRQPLPGHAPSATARAGLWAWAKTASHQLIDDGITINTACPGAHRTDRMKEIQYSGPLGDPEDFGRIVAFLCSQPAGWLSGSAINVDGAEALSLL